jgi:hypothetical protein
MVLVQSISANDRPDDDCGRDRPRAGAEGATAPEPLRQKDRSPMAFWKAGR